MSLELELLGERYTVSFGVDRWKVKVQLTNKATY